MGLNCSTLNDLESNEYLEKFCGTDVISPNDPLWNNLFSHSMRPIFTKDDSFLMDSCVENLKNSLITNNLNTKNFPSLVKAFALRAEELKSSVQTGDTLFIWQAYNALFMVRCVSKYLVENLNQESFVKQCQSLESRESEDESGGAVVLEEGDVLELLIESVVKIIVEIPVQSNTYVLQLEATNTLIVLLSSQMFWSKPAYRLPAFRVMMQSIQPSLAVQLTHALLRNYVEQKEPPYSIWHSDETGSIVIGMASGLWNLLRKGVGLGKTDDVLEGLKQHNLPNQCLYLLLVLINHCTAAGDSNVINPYREALVTFGNDTVSSDGVNSMEVSMFKLNYAKVYETICEKLTSDETTLLLYFLIHRNNEFKSYIMARSDIELLVLPILKTLYNAPTSTSYHIYMSLIVMLILSEDQLFNQQVHDIVLKQVPWYTERKVTDITLGGLTILVVIRTIQYNILKMRDKYLHTNCLAALANMSSKFRSLHPYVAQRLVSVFETLAKRHLKLIEKLEGQSTTTSSKTESEKASETIQDINVLEEVIRMLLEILNSTLTHQLPQNRHLVYTLLYKKDVFDTFREYDATQDLVYNLDIIIQYFTKRLGPDSGELSVSEVMEKIEDGNLHWSPDILRKFPDLKFRYVEEEQPENFFIPYVWSLVYRNSGLYWSPINLALSSLDGEYCV